MTRNRKMWTEEEEQFLIDNYGWMEDEALAEELGRSVRAIKLKIAYLMDTTDKTQLIDGYRVSEISKLTGIPVPTIKHKIINDEFCNASLLSGVYFVEYDELWEWIKLNENDLKIVNVKLSDLSTAPTWYKEFVFEMKELENRYLTKLEKYVKLNSEVKKWSDEEIEIYKVLIGLGVSYKKLEDMTKRTARAIQVKMKRVE